ncbi:hypothetical protein [Salmonella enterica]|uniref:hypothetical protein n=1 Tax=Salmonella enterica TaxID=28901 RepID=UPI00234CAC7D|nr:hypothetical protein [Salmonella enterica]HCZ5078877.1 hypothetical protein [Salmonella enterica]HCZ5271155.1 hypothetical protein [Salmonella enterica]
MAGKQKTFTQDVRQKIEATLDNLPEKPKAERPLTTKELVTELRGKIRAAQAKGYTLEEIVDLFKSDGAQISLSSVKSALKGSSQRSSRTTKPAQSGEQTAQQAASNAQPDGSHNGG